MNTHIANTPEPVHVVALSGCYSLAEKIRYACEHNRGADTTAIGAWLVRYRVTVPWDYLSTVVGEWRTENNLSAAIPAAPGHRGAVVTARPKPVGVFGFYTVAFMSMLVSIDTSWRFFGDVLGITDTAERLVMFAVLEVALIACGYGMRANVQRSGRPGAPRLVAWVLCGLAGYMAWQLSGVAAGIARVALGPALGLVMLHLALGIEIRAGQHQATTWARIGRELRERLLSRLGLSDDERDALARTRDRAARRVARLSLARFVPFRSARRARALRASNVAHDPAARGRMLAELAAIRHAGDLATLDQPSPWRDVVNGATNATATVHHGPAGPFANDATAVADTPGEHRPRPVRPRSRNGRQTGGKGSRKLFADYLAEARAAWTPGTVVTPAWVREAIECSRGTSKKVADALTAEIDPNGGVGVAA